MWDVIVGSLLIVLVGPTIIVGLMIALYACNGIPKKVDQKKVKRRLGTDKYMNGRVIPRRGKNWKPPYSY